MKRLQIIVLTAAIFLVSISAASAGDRRVNGLLIGAGSGALIGQAAGQNAESVILGTAIGGAVGYAIGSSLDRKDRVYDVHYGPSTERVVTHYRERDRWRGYREPYRPYRDRYYHDSKRYRGHDRDCVKSVRYIKRHGEFTRIVKTTCDAPSRPGWRNFDRKWYR